jgi:hypothetical protein
MVTVGINDSGIVYGSVDIAANAMQPLLQPVMPGK